MCCYSVLFKQLHLEPICYRPLCEEILLQFFFTNLYTSLFSYFSFHKSIHFVHRLSYWVTWSKAGCTLAGCTLDGMPIYHRIQSHTTDNVKMPIN